MQNSKTAAADVRSRPSRLAAYYVLLFFFIFLTGLLLRELELRLDLQAFQKISALVQQAFSFWMEFDQFVVTIFSLLLAFLFSLPIAWVYTITKTEDDPDPSMVQTLVILTMVVTGVMIVVGSDLARAFSLVGVVAAVRFRNTLKDPKDAVYIFIAVAIGMGCGFGVYLISVWLSVAMSLTLLLMWKYKFGKPLRPVTVAEFLGEGAEGRKLQKQAQRLFDLTSTEIAQRLEQDLERQLRLRHYAELAGNANNKKKANAALVIAATDAGKAQNHIEKTLAGYGGKWQLAGVQSGDGHNTIFEYVGRAPKENSPAALLAALQAKVDSSISGIAFHSLKGG
ncbi:MAG: DUF4956 domain-containing protein, partial [bacterium]